MRRDVLPLSTPNLSGNEWEYVKQCLDSGWISTAGEFVERFEHAVCDYIGSEHAVAVTSGTAALHIGLILAGVQRNDYVVMPNLTFVATANAISYLGAEPLLVDVDPNTWQIDVPLLADFLSEHADLDASGNCVLKSNGRRIRAVVPVHVQGNIGDMAALSELTGRLGLTMLEDAAQSLGSTYRGKHAGNFGKIGCLSFNGNKILSCGGGGMLVTDDGELASLAKHLTTTAKVDPMYYVHDQVGYNYRLPNVLAAIGLAQVEQMDAILARKREIGATYRSELTGVDDIQFQEVLADVEYNHWLVTIRSSHQQMLLRELNARNIMCRPLWMPMHRLPMYQPCIYVTKSNCSDRLVASCLALPCSSGLSSDELGVAVKEVKGVLRRSKENKAVKADR